jgi:hypothetical protein
MAPGLFSRRSYDADAPAYAAVRGSTSPRAPAHSDSDVTEDEEEAGGERDMEVLREEEEREKLLSGGQGLFGSIGRKVGNGSIKIGKKVRGMGRRKGVREVVAMMGGKRLGMEEGGEFGIGTGSDTGSDSEIEEDELLAEKLAYERKVGRLLRESLSCSSCRCWNCCIFLLMLRESARIQYIPPDIAHLFVLLLFLSTVSQ